VDVIADIMTLADLTDRVEDRWWFRGQADIAWALQPGVLRPRFIERARFWFPNHPSANLMLERDLVRRFRTNAAAYLSSPEIVDVYLAAQHQGVPTRLLDWTRDPMAALFFVLCDEDRRDVDGSFWMLDPTCPVRSYGGARIASGPLVDRDDFVAQQIYPLFELDREWSDDGVIAPLSLSPSRFAGRIYQQQSRFTLHPPGRAEIPVERLRLLRVPAKAKSILWRDLHRLGVGWDTLFPDAEHTARQLVQEYGLHRDDVVAEPGRELPNG
jgi:hypothetical protein